MVSILNPQSCIGNRSATEMLNTCFIHPSRMPLFNGIMYVFLVEKGGEKGREYWFHC